jgi:hypothetical protein
MGNGRVFWEEQFFLYANGAKALRCSKERVHAHVNAGHLSCCECIIGKKE